MNMTILEKIELKNNHFNHFYYIAKNENKKMIEQYIEKIDCLKHITNNTILIRTINENHTIVFYENEQDKIIVKLAILKQYEALERM